MKNFLAKKVIVATSCALVFSMVSPISNGFANESVEPLDENLIEDLKITDESNLVESDFKLDSEVLSEDFDLEEEVENIPSLDEMTIEQKELFDSLVQEEAKLAGLDGEENDIFTSTIEEFFTEGSDTYQDLDSATLKMEQEFESSESSDTLSFLNEVFGENEAQAVQVKIGVRLAGSILNVAIGVAVGGGVGAIQAYIINKGKEEAKRIFTRTVTSRLKAWGASKLAWAVGASVAIALDYMNIGLQIAKQLDKRDKRPNNGWIDFY